MSSISAECAGRSTPIGATVRDSTSIRRMEEAAGEQVYRKWNEGMGVCPEIAPQEHELVLPKHAASAFTSSMPPRGASHWPVSETCCSRSERDETGARAPAMLPGVRSIC